MKITRGRLIAVGVGATILIILAAATRPRPTEVDVAVVSRGAMETTVDAEGRTRVRERYVVAAPVSGRVERMAFVEGAPVHRGDAVAVLTPLALDAQSAAQARARADAADALQRSASAATHAADAALAQARRDAARAHRLGEAGGIAPREVERADLALRQSEEDARSAHERSIAAAADVRHARAALLGTQGAEGKIVVRAPADGRVLRIPERSERTVAAGTVLLEVGDPASLEIVADVLSSDGATIRAGDPVRIEGWTGNGGSETATTLAGRVRDVEPSAFTKVSALGVDEQRVNVVIDLAAPPPTIGDGFRVDVSVVTWSARDVLTIPTSALARDGDAWTVYAIEGGRARRRAVRIGRIGASAAELLGGLDVGARVVAFPSDKISDGARVTGR